VDATSMDGNGNQKTQKFNSSIELESGKLGIVGTPPATTREVVQKKSWPWGHVPGLASFFTREQVEEDTVKMLIFVQPERSERTSGSPMRPPAGN
jgi:hypothetical protein